MRVLTLLTVVMLLAAAAIVNNGKLLGHNMRPNETADTLHNNVSQNDTLRVAADGSMVVNTTVLGKDITGFAGPVPLKVYVSAQGVVTRIEALPNGETPDFFERAQTLLQRWQGKTVDEALALQVDGVSGATFSSEAIKGNVASALRYVKAQAPADEPSKPWTLVPVVSTLAALLAAVVPLFVRTRRWHVVQMAVNVVVLGLWSGTFISYALLLRLFTGGVAWSQIAVLAAPLVMLVTAFVYPLFGKANYYCANVCPFGSAQELVGLLCHRKVRLPRRVAVGLETFRHLLWGTLVALLVTGIWTSWVDYELFTAFLVSSASVWVVVAAVVFLVLSAFVPRPYCRFVCPTGALMRRF